MSSIKLLSVTLCVVFSVVRATRSPWSAANAGSYVTGTKVSDAGQHYECRPWPNGGWCKNPRYRPSGDIGLSAWIHEGPAGGSGGKGKGGGGGKGTQPTPPRATPPRSTPPRGLPPMGKCKGNVPTNPPAWKPYGAAPNDHHNGRDFVSHRGRIWQAKWWATTEPGTDNVWENCGPHVQGQVVVSVSGLSSGEFELKLGNRSFTIPHTGSTIPRGPGTYPASVAALVNMGTMKVQVPSVSPASIVITGSADYPLSVSFTERDIVMKGVSLTVTLPGSPNPAPKAIVVGKGYNTQVQLAAGSVSIQVPEYGTYTIAAESYNVDGKLYTAPRVTVTDGALDGGATITYVETNPRIVAGYMPVSWNTALKFTEVAQNGYNVALPSFIKVIGNNPIEFTDNQFKAFCGWRANAHRQEIADAIKADIKVAKERYGLKYAIASMGGQNNTFNPQGANVDDLARRTVAWLQRYGMDGIDFDLEGIPPGLTAGYITDYIQAMKREMPFIIITCAPQVHRVGNSLQYVNHGTQQIYNDSIARGLYDYILVQQYNTGGNYVNRQGDLCSGPGPGCHDQTTPGFIVNSFYALNKLTPARTFIVAGQPVNRDAAGRATIYWGPNSATAHQDMAVAYSQLLGEAQFGGAMSWEVSMDHDQQNAWVRHVAPVVLSGRVPKFPTGGPSPTLPRATQPTQPQTTQPQTTQPVNTQPGGRRSECRGNVPEDAPAWERSRNHYVGASFVSHKGSIWMAKWWANQGVEPGTDTVWAYCRKQNVGTLVVTSSGLVGHDTFVLKVNGESHTVNKNGGRITVGRGNQEITVDAIVDIPKMEAYVATVDPGVINVQEVRDYPVTVAFTETPVQPKVLDITVNFAEEPVPLPNAIVAGKGYRQSVQLRAGANSISIPEFGTYTISPMVYQIGSITHGANPLTAVNGVLSGGSVITYGPRSPKVIAGYFPVSWHRPVKVSEAARKGYNIAIPAFIWILNNQAIYIHDKTWVAYGPWGVKASEPRVINAIKADIAMAKRDLGLKYVIPSVGGEHNTFNPKGENVDVLARRTVDFLRLYTFDGIDFDLEIIPGDITSDYIVEFIRALKRAMPEIIITCAPQVNNVGGRLDYVNTSVQQVYTPAINAGLFHYIFVQMYNTGGNYVNREGNLCSAGSENCHDQKTSGFIVNSFYALKKLTPPGTYIVAGMPVNSKAGGDATVYRGPEASFAWRAQNAAYAQLAHEPQFGGAMSWEVSLDAMQEYKWIDGIKDAVMP